MRFSSFISEIKLSRAAAVIAGTMALAPLSAEAFMRTVSDAELAGLDQIEDTGYSEHYESLDIGSHEFGSIYIAPVENAMEQWEIYDRSLRPHHIDELTEDFHQRLIAALAPSGLLVDTPAEDSLVINVAITEVQEYHAFSTGSFIPDSAAGRRNRGGAVMEMTWHAGPGGPLLLAIRDGRQPHQEDPLRDPDDNFTDVKVVFDLWAADLAGFFGIAPQDAPTN